MESSTISDTAAERRKRSRRADVGAAPSTKAQSSAPDANVAPQGGAVSFDMPSLNSIQEAAAPEKARSSLPPLDLMSAVAVEAMADAEMDATVRNERSARSERRDAGSSSRTRSGRARRREGETDEERSARRSARSARREGETDEERSARRSARSKRRADRRQRSSRRRPNTSSSPRSSPKREQNRVVGFDLPVDVQERRNLYYGTPMESGASGGFGATLPAAAQTTGGRFSNMRPHTSHATCRGSDRRAMCVYFVCLLCV